MVWGMQLAWSCWVTGCACAMLCKALLNTFPRGWHHATPTDSIRHPGTSSAPPPPQCWVTAAHFRQPGRCEEGLQCGFNLYFLMADSDGHFLMFIGVWLCQLSELTHAPFRLLKNLKTAKGSYSIPFSSFPSSPSFQP